MNELTLDHLLWRMLSVNPSSEVVSALGPEGSETRMSFEEVAWRIEALAHGLRDTGVSSGDTVTVLAWNVQQHLELLLAVPLIGAKLNSVNVRLGTTALEHLVTGPQPRVVVFDEDLLTHAMVGEDIAVTIGIARRQGITLVPFSTRELGRKGVPESTYEQLIAGNLGRRWVEEVLTEETSAFIFNTGGTTGLPKSYEVSHRAAILHSLSQATVDATGLSVNDKVMPLAPFFHVNGWGLPLTSLLTGTSIVLVGGDMSPSRVAKVIYAQEVTVAAGVPTVWHDICEAVSKGEAPAPLMLREVLTGGSPVPEPLWRDIERVLGAGVANAWGMTETMACSSYERKQPDARAGKPIPLIELRLEDFMPGTSGSDKDSKRLKAKGPFVIGNCEPDRWFITGDVASFDSKGNLTLHDRENDLIKSGGEWIVSAEIEQHLVRHPLVESAIVVAMPNPKWIERPIAYIIHSKEDAGSPEDEQLLRDYLAQKFPRWWVPDRFEFVSDLPRTATGKIDKKSLRQSNFKEKV